MRAWLVPFAVVAFAFALRGQDLERGAAFEECTIGIAAGRATADGRPLLWKNRDAKKLDNVVMPLADGKIPYFALCDAGDATAVWGGANVAGFCIINSVARDLPGGSEQGPNNGAFMKLALQQCASVAEFEALLQRTNEQGRRTRANFGVIDALGAAACFEAGHRTFHRFDADQSDHGILVRTNFATTANGERGRERFARAEELCRSPRARELTPRFLLQLLLRDLKAPPSAQAGGKGRMDARETIHRQSTVAALVLHGVKPGVDAKWTTMWAVLGQPLFSMAVPLFPAAGSVPIALAGDPRSAICAQSQRLAGTFYVAADPGEGNSDEDAAEPEVAGALRWLRTDTMPLVRRSILFGEADVLARYEEAVAVWRKAGPAPAPPALRAFQEAMAKLVLEQLTELADAQVGVGAGK